MNHEGYFLAVGRDGNTVGSAPEAAPDMLLLVIVFPKGYLHLLRLRAVLQGIEVSVPAERQSAVCRYAEETYRMLFEAGYLPSVAAPDVGVSAPVVCLRLIRDGAVRASPAGASLFGQIVPAVAVGSPYGIAVFPYEGRLLCEAAAAIEPDVPGNRGSMMLAEGVFIALYVFVEKRAFGIN